MAFGIDSLIEAASPCVLLWRLNLELRQGKHFAESIERRASRISGALLLALAPYVVAVAGWSLWKGKGEEFTVVGLIITGATIPVMSLLARRSEGNASTLTLKRPHLFLASTLMGMGLPENCRRGR